MTINRIRTALALSAAALALAAPTAPAATSDAHIDAVPGLREKVNEHRQLEAAQAAATPAGDDFDWSDAAVGAVGAVALTALGAGAGLAAARIRRRESALVG